MAMLPSRAFVRLVTLACMPSSHAAYEGYHYEARGPNEIMGVKTHLGNISGFSQGLTISAWIRYFDVSNVLQSEVVINTAADNFFFGGFGGPGHNFALGKSSSFRGLQPLERFTEWHHYTWTYDYTEFAQYIDGVQVQKAKISSQTDWYLHYPLMTVGGFCWHTRSSNVNQRRECYMRDHRGQIDDLGVWTGALNASHVAEVWNASLTTRLASHLEPELAIFYNFDDPGMSIPNELPNLGVAGSAYNMLTNAIDGSDYGGAFSTVGMHQNGVVRSVTPASFVGASPIPNKAPDPAWSRPIVAHARPNETISLASLGFPSETYTAPEIFSATANLTIGGRSVHIVPLVAPAPLDAFWRTWLTVEDNSINIRLSPGGGHAWPNGLRPIITRLPTRGTLYVQTVFDGTSTDKPITFAGQSVDEASLAVRYVPDLNQFGTPFDDFGVAMRLRGVPAGGGSAAAIETASVTFTISIDPVNDVPHADSSHYAFAEDSLGEAGLPIMLQLRDYEVGQILAGQITKLPSIGDLYVVDPLSSSRTRVTAAYNAFDVGLPIVRQYASAVLDVSSHWGSAPPYMGYHANGILGPPDCYDTTVANECANIQPWRDDLTQYPQLSQHIFVRPPGADAAHVGYVRAVHRANTTLDVEMHQYYKLDAVSGAWLPCYLGQPFSPAAYPDGCLFDNAGGGLNSAHGRPIRVNVNRADISPVDSAIWCPLKQKDFAGVQSSGGWWGPQYRFVHNHATYSSKLYNEYIDLAIDEPVYIFGVIIGMPRGAGAVVGIRARDPFATAGSDEEWVLMYEQAARKDVGELQDRSFFYYKFKPQVCRTNFKTNAIRVEMDTSDETGVSDWNYIDYVEVVGSGAVQAGALDKGANVVTTEGSNAKTVTQSVSLVYVPHPNAYGTDNFEYKASDCPGDIFRSSAPATVSFAISPVNDVPMQLATVLNVTLVGDTDDLTTVQPFDMRSIVNDVETPFTQLTLTFTTLPSTATFFDGGNVISTLPHKLSGDTVTFRFDSLDGMQAEPDETDENDILRRVVAGHVSFTASDVEGATLAASLLMRVYRPELACTRPDHGVIFKGGVAVCEHCPLGLSASSYSPTCDVCAKDFFRPTAASSVADCVPCPALAICGVDTTVQTLQMQSGAWRLSNQTTEIHLCRNADESAIETTRGSSILYSPCVGGPSAGVDGRGYCLEGHTGPKCEACVNRSMYFNDDGICVACPDGGGVLQIISNLSAVVLSLLLFVAVCWWLYVNPPNKTCKRIKRQLAFATRKLRALGFVGKFKILVAFLQIWMNIPAFYGIDIPDELREWFDFFRFAPFTLDLDAFGYPTACLGSMSNRLFLTAVAPIVLAATFYCIGLLWAIAQERVGSKTLRDLIAHLRAAKMTRRLWSRRLKVTHLVVTPVALFIVFCAYPAVGLSIFETWLCDPFTESAGRTRSFLRLSVSIECHSDAWDGLQQTAVLLIFVWPLAMPLLFFTLLWYARAAIRKGKPHFTDILTSEYRVEFWWWECLDLLRRLSLNGLLIALFQDEQLATLRLILATLIALVFFCLQIVLQPYNRPSDNVLAVTAACFLYVGFFAALLVRVHNLVGDVIATFLPPGKLTEALASVFSFSDVYHLCLMLILVAFLLLALVALSMIWGMRITILRAHRARLAHEAASIERGRMASPPKAQWTLHPQASYCCFLSHFKQEAGSDARYLHDLIIAMCGAPVFLDSVNLTDLDALFEDGVHKSEVVVALATTGYLSRPWCLLELWEAHCRQIPVFVVPVAGHGFNKTAARKAIENLESELTQSALDVILTHLRTHHGYLGLDGDGDELGVFKDAMIEVLQLSEKQGRASFERTTLQALFGRKRSKNSRKSSLEEKSKKRENDSNSRKTSRWTYMQKSGRLFHNVEGSQKRITAPLPRKETGLIWEPSASDDGILAFGCALLNQMALVTGRTSLQWVDKHEQYVKEMRRQTRERSKSMDWLRTLTGAAGLASPKGGGTGGARSLLVLVDPTDPKALSTARVLQHKIQQSISRLATKADEWVVNVSGGHRETSVRNLAVEDEAQLSLAVADASAVILLQTARVLHQSMLLVQLYEIIEGGVTPLVPVRTVSGGYEFGAASTTLHDLDKALTLSELSKLRTYLELRNVTLPQLSTCLEERLPHIISLSFDAEATELEIKAFCATLCKRLPSAREVEEGGEQGGSSMPKTRKRSVDATRKRSVLSACSTTSSVDGAECRKRSVLSVGSTGRQPVSIEEPPLDAQVPAAPAPVAAAAPAVAGGADVETTMPMPNARPIPRPEPPPPSSNREGSHHGEAHGHALVPECYSQRAHRGQFHHIKQTLHPQETARERLEKHNARVQQQWQQRQVTRSPARQPIKAGGILDGGTAQHSDGVDEHTAVDAPAAAAAPAEEPSGLSKMMDGVTCRLSTYFSTRPSESTESAADGEKLSWSNEQRAESAAEAPDPGAGVVAPPPRDATDSDANLEEESSRASAGGAQVRVLDADELNERGSLIERSQMTFLLPAPSGGAVPKDEASDALKA